MTRNFVVLLGLVLAAGIGSLAWATEGFRVVTSAGARELAIERSAPAVPDVTLVDQDGRAFSLGDYRGRTVLVDFIYTRCPTICSVYGDDFHRVLARLGRTAAGREIDLLSISFDAENDDQEALKLYGGRYGAVAPRWRVARPVNGQDLSALLKTFGVVAIPDGIGGFVHDSTVFVVNAQGRLARVLDPEAPEQLAAETERVATP